MLVSKKCISLASILLFLQYFSHMHYIFLFILTLFLKTYKICPDISPICQHISSSVLHIFYICLARGEDLSANGFSQGDLSQGTLGKGSQTIKQVIPFRVAHLRHATAIAFCMCTCGNARFCWQELKHAFLPCAGNM